MAQEQYPAFLDRLSLTLVAVEAIPVVPAEQAVAATLTQATPDLVEMEQPILAVEAALELIRRVAAVPVS